MSDKCEIIHNGIGDVHVYMCLEISIWCGEDQQKLLHRKPLPPRMTSSSSTVLMVLSSAFSVSTVLMVLSSALISVSTISVSAFSVSAVSAVSQTNDWK